MFRRSTPPLRDQRELHGKALGGLAVAERHPYRCSVGLLGHSLVVHGLSCLCTSTLLFQLFLEDHLPPLLVHEGTLVLWTNLTGPVDIM